MSRWRIRLLFAFSCCWSFSWASSYWQQTTSRSTTTLGGTTSTTTWSQTTTTTAAAAVIPTPPSIQHDAASTTQPTPTPLSETMEIIPDMDLHHVALSLRLVCELNRRLGLQTVFMQEQEEEDDDSALLLGGGHDPLRGGGGGAVHVHPSKSWQPPIAASHRDVAAAAAESFESNEKELLTVFHAKLPRRNSKKTTKARKQRRRGAARWGPDLHVYLEYLMDSVFCLDNEMMMKNRVLVLAMVYLDRACSVETPRRHGGKRCPFVTPRTVHRLVLTAMWMAQQAVVDVEGHDGNEQQQQQRRITELLGIPAAQLHEMEQWMRQALGEPGLYVSPVELVQWKRTWEQTFSSSLPKAAASAQRRRRRQQQVIGDGQGGASSRMVSQQQSS